MENKIDVLDKGYVILQDWMGSDLTPVNTARASFKKRSEELNQKDERLIGFLVREKHTAPFRHGMLQFEICAPIMVARQWWKYLIGSGHQEPVDLSLSNAWNEMSGRYVTQDLEFYTPEAGEWRGAAKNRKQGSDGVLEEDRGKYYTDLHKDLVNQCLTVYNKALEEGMAPEQARLFLPYAGMYTTWYWTVSLCAVIHFLTERLDQHAQWEIRQYAQAVKTFVKQKFPLSFQHFIVEDSLDSKVA